MKDEMCRCADEVLETFLEGVLEDHSHRRMVKQQVKCGYGLSGVCCKLCSNGPCRISPARPKGVCGADADTIAARNFLRSVAAGSGCYIHVVENTAKRLKEAGIRGDVIRGKEMLYTLCEKLGILGSSDSEKCIHLADAILEDLRRPYEEEMVLTQALAYEKRLPLWKSLGLMPHGAKDEIFNSIVKTSTNLSSNVMDMMVQCLRLGISTGVYGLVLTNLLNDILIGPPKIGFERVGLSAIDPGMINIMMTGHQQSIYGDLICQLERPEIQNLAKSVGAKGFKLVGCTCVGQDFQMRHNQNPEIFCGHVGNNYTSEAALLTDCIDLVVSDFNCTIPGIEPICKEKNIPMLCLDDVALKNEAKLLQYTSENREEISSQILSSALVSYLSGEKQRINPMAHHGQAAAIVGVSEGSLKEVLGGSYKPLIDVIASGRIKGIAAVVGCSNLRADGDGSIAMISVGSLAVGYLILNLFSKSANLAGDVCSTLFGATSILTLSKADVYLCVGLSIIVIGVFIVFYHKIFAITFDENFATATGTKAGSYNLLIAIITAFIIVLAMNLVGSLLISALVIFPALSSMRVYKNFKSVVISSACVSVVCAVLGILISILISSPVGSTIVACNIIVFCMYSLIGKINGGTR